MRTAIALTAAVFIAGCTLGPDGDRSAAGPPGVATSVPAGPSDGDRSPRAEPSTSPVGPPSVSAPPVGTNEATCANAEVGYSLAYPADWFVHPPDPNLEVPACSYFAPDPFVIATADPPVLGAVLMVTDFEGGCLEFDAGIPDVLDEVVVARLPAHRVAHEIGSHAYYSYVVNLRPQDGPVLGTADSGPCGFSHGLLIRTDAWSEGIDQLHRRVVDRIAATIRVDVVVYAPGTGSDPHCPFPRDVELTFAGRATLEELGFEDPGGPLQGEVGMVYVTAGPVPLGNPQPQRAWCRVIRIDGRTTSGVGLVPLGWKLPAIEP